MQPKVNPKILLAVGSTISIGGVFASTFMKQFWWFYLCYSFFFGIGVGMVYLIPMMCCWEYFPDRKGMVSGVIIGGFGFGTFIFGFISTALINPNDYSLKKHHEKYYPPEVADNTPICLRWLCLMWAILALIAIILV